MTVIPALAARPGRVQYRNRIDSGNPDDVHEPAGESCSRTTSSSWAACWPFLMRYTALERLPLLLVAIAAYFFAQSNPKLTLAFMLAALTVMHVAGGAMLPAWMGLMAKIFPVNVRGRFFALGRFLGEP